jgi:hypothetical protein
METTPWWHPRQLLREDNAGLLLDLVVLVANLLLMDPLVRIFLVAAARAGDGDTAATVGLALFTLALFSFQPIGAVLKRWHVHRRAGGKLTDPIENGCSGCLFNPIFYFCLQTIVFSSAMAFLFQFLGDEYQDNGAVFVPVLFAGIVLMIANVVLVYRYFSPPPRPPRYAWMRWSGTERVGDAFLFANMLGYQVFWNLLSQMEFPRVSGVGDLIGRLVLVFFIALLLYFPPRMLYLFEDIHRPRTWVSMAIANSPLIWRLVIGSGAAVAAGAG